MQDQVIGQKVGNRTGVASGRRSGGAVQRPLPRSRGESRKTVSARLHRVLGYLPTVLKLFLAAAALALVFIGYRAAASASFFQVRNVDVQGVSRASRDKIQSVVRRAAEPTGVWNADLEGISSELGTLPWVRNAVVTRVLPDEIRIRITERVPRVVARMSSGRFLWVDDDAMLLGEMQPVDQMPPFFLRGWNDDETETARKENKTRVRKFLELQEEWQAAGLAERVSEVNLVDLRDVRAQLAGDDSQIEVRLGSEDLGKRLRQALEVLDEKRQSPRGQFITYIDLSQGKRAVVGFRSGAQVTSETTTGSEPSTDDAGTSNTRGRTNNMRRNSESDNQRRRENRTTARSSQNR